MGNVQEALRHLLELTYSGLVNKQKNITKLFPTFYQRVKKVADNGGVKLFDMDANKWHFKINSGTEKGKKYDAYINWKTLPQKIKKFGTDKAMWNKEETALDLRKLAAKILYDTDLETVCSCPADLYWGGQYIRTQKKAKYTSPEDRPPNIRNPQQHGAYCKHLGLLMSVLPMYVATLASYMKMHYKEDIAKVEKAVGIKGKEEDFDKQKKEVEADKKKEDLKKEKEKDKKKPGKPTKKKSEDEEEDESEETKESRMIGGLIGSYTGRR